MWIPAEPAWAAPHCPTTLGTFVFNQQRTGFLADEPEWKATHGAGISCRYTSRDAWGPLPPEHVLVVEWQPANTATETYYCAEGTFARGAAGVKSSNPATGDYHEGCNC
jgi:hypothetical protein